MSELWRGAQRPGQVERAEIAERSWSTPWDAPAVPPFPVGFRDVTVLTVCYRSDREAIEQLVPAPLEVISDVVVAHIYRMPDVDFMGQVNECNVMVGVRLGADTIGGYTTAQYLDSPEGVAHGREVHGQPKKLAEVSLETHGDLVVGRVTRNGIEVLTATLPYKQRPCPREDMLAHYDFSESINLKLIPSIDGSLAIRQLTARRLQDVQVSECHTGPCTVDLRPNAQAPVFRLPVREALDGFLWRTDFTLTEGRVLHDYSVEQS